MSDSPLSGPIRPGYLEHWEQLAEAHAPHTKLGDVNWPWIVRSLIAEVRRLNGDST